MQRTNRPRLSLRQTNRITQKQKQRRILYASLSFAALFGIGFYLLQMFNHEQIMAANTNTWTNGNGNGNWNTAANWSLGRVPNSSDIATFDASTASDCDIHGAINVAGINITGSYTGRVIQASGAALTIGSSGFAQAGGTFSGGSSSVIINAGTFTLSGGTFRSTSGNLTFSGNYTASATIFTHSGGTFDHNNGTVSVSPSIANWNSIALTFDVTSSTLLNNVIVNTATCCNIVSVTTAAGDTVRVNNNFTHTDGAINGLFAFKGNLTINSAADGGSGWLIAEGTASQTYSSAGNYRTCGLMINKTSGSLSAAGGTTDLSIQRFSLLSGSFTAPSGNFRVGSNWNSNVTLFEHTGGTFDANNGTAILDPYINGWSASVFTADVLSSTQFYNLTVNGTSCCNQNVLITAAGDTLHVMNNLVHTDGMINGQIDFKGSLTINSTSDGGSGTLTANGTTDQYYTSASNYRTCGIAVNKTSGTFKPNAGTTALSCQKFLLTAGGFTAPAGTFYIGGNWNANTTIFQHNGGVFTNNSGTVSFDPAINGWSASTFTIDVDATTSFNNIILNGSTCCSQNIIACASGDTLQAAGALTHTDGFISASVRFSGNLTVSSGADGGSGWFIATGSAAQTYSAAGNYRTAGLMIDKDANGLSPAGGTTTFALQRLSVLRGTFTAPSGILNVGGYWNSNVTIFAQSGGSFIHNSGTVSFDPAINGWSASTFTIDPDASTQFNDLIINGSTCCSQNVITTPAGDTVAALGSITHTDGFISGAFSFKNMLTVNSGADGGSGWLVATGTAAQNYVSAGAYRTAGLMIAKSSGSLAPQTGTTTLSVQRMQITSGDFTAPTGTMYIGGNWNANVNIYQQTGGTFNHNSGTVSFDPAINGWSATTFTIDVMPSTQFNSVIVNGSTCCSQNNIATAAGDTVRALADLTHTDSYITGVFEFMGNLIINSGADGGSGWLVADGTASQTYACPGTYRTCGLLINKSSGTMDAAAGTTMLGVQRLQVNQGTFTAPTGNLNIGGYWNANVDLYKQTGGTFIHNNGTVNFDAAINGWSASTFNVDVLPATTFYNVIYNITSCCSQAVLTTTANDTIDALNNVTHTDGYISAWLSFKNTLTVNSTADGGDGWMIADGTADQTFVCSSGYRTCGLAINKASGTMAAASGTTYLGIQRFNLVTGTFLAPATLSIGGNWNANVNLFTQSGGTFSPNNGTVLLNPVINGWSASTFTLDVIPATIFYDLNLNATSCCSQPIINGAAGDTINVSNNMLFTDGRNNALIGARGNVNVYPTFDGGTGVLLFNGTGNQNFDASGAVALFDGNIKLSKSSGKVYLTSPVTLDAASQSMIFSSGILVSTASNILNFGDNVTVSGAGNTSFVDGPVKKTGNDVFTFPIGKNDTIYAPLRISAPSVTSDEFIAEYFRGDPDPLYSRSSKDASIINVSACEYWGLSRNTGTSSVTVNLSFGNVRSCGVSVPTELVVSRWDGARWKNNGRSAVTGTAANGTITSSGTAATYNAFTLGSSTSNNALPITLISFDANWNNGQVDLKWSTASEENNDFFTVERSPDLIEITETGRVNGSGTTTAMHTYTSVDPHPLSTIAYYRLRQTDYDGTSTVTDWKQVYPGKSDRQFEFNLYPNPSDGAAVQVNLPGDANADLEVEVYTVTGMLITRTTVPVARDQYEGHIDFPERLASGNYIVNLRLGDKVASVKMQVR